MTRLEEISYPAVTIAQMQEIDRIAMEDRGISGEFLMENAGKAVFKNIEQLFPRIQQVAVLVGKGNNGGDGLVIARRLAEAGKKVVLLTSCDTGKFSGLSRIMWEKLSDLSLEVFCLNTESKIKIFQEKEINVDLVVDALFGIGLKGEVRLLEKKLIELVQKMNVPVIAVDCPSGLNCDNGNPLGIALRAEKTITFGAPKKGFFRYPGPDYVGELVVADIGFPADIIENKKDTYYYLNMSKMGRLLPVRKRIFHKGDAGKVVIIGGSSSMSGAVVLAARAAYRSGAGLVYVLVPDNIAPNVASQVTEPIVVGLRSTTDGTISQLALEKITAYTDNCDVVLLGPGIGRNKELVELMKKLLAPDKGTDPDKLRVHYIFDADAIHNIKNAGINLKEYHTRIAFTPHTGELAYFLGKSVQYLNSHRFDACFDFSRNTEKLLILKGSATLICQGEKIFINPTGNPGMASGGSGDVLAGIYAALLGQDMSLLEAACLAVFIHGYAGDLAAGKKSVYSLTAQDIIDFLPETYCALEKMK